MASEDIWLGGAKYFPPASGGGGGNNLRLLSQHILHNSHIYMTYGVSRGKIAIKNLLYLEDTPDHPDLLDGDNDTWSRLNIYSLELYCPMK